MKATPLLAATALAASLFAVSSADAFDRTKPVKVFILAGQSNMEGKAKLSLLEYQAAQPATRGLFEHLRKDGKWIERDDVWIKVWDRKGKLTVGYGSPNCIGPELEFGWVVGDRYDVVLVKTDAFWDMEADAVFRKGCARTSTSRTRLAATIRTTTSAAPRRCAGLAGRWAKRCWSYEGRGSEQCKECPPSYPAKSSRSTC